MTSTAHRSLAARQLLHSDRFTHVLSTLATRLDRPVGGVLREARAALMSMVSVHSPFYCMLVDRGLGPLHTNAWQVKVDPGALEHLKQASRHGSLVFLPTHRSYADGFIITKLLHEAGLPRNHVLGGDNLSFFPLGTIARRAGAVFLRRSFKDDEVYKTVVREYLRHLVAQGANLEWYMEGGRSRTGKLRPPKYGLLRYLVDAIESGGAGDIQLVPVAITYDQLHEVRKMAAEEAGLPKAKEGLGWLVNYARQSRRAIGTVYVRFGETLSLRDALAHTDGSAQTARWTLDKVAFEVFQRINRVTPVTAPALVTLALLGVHDHALTLEEVRAAIAPLLDYVERRGLPTAAVASLRETAGLEQALEVLVNAGVVRRFSEGLTPVFHIVPGKHSEAAFYRNSAIHWFVNRAIVELGIVVALRDGMGDPVERAWNQVFALRDLLKFEFFFSEKSLFRVEIKAEGQLIDPQFDDHIAAWRAHRERTSSPGYAAVAAGVVRPQGISASLLSRSPFLVAHRVLPAFLEAYFIVADRLSAHPAAEPVEEAAFLAQCIAVGRQYVLQKRLRNPECISRELFGNALALAANRGLLNPATPDLRAHRRRFAEETEAAVAAVAVIGELDYRRRLGAREEI